MHANQQHCCIELLLHTCHRAADLQGAVHSQLNWQTSDEDTFQTLVHSRISVERGRSLSSPCQAVCLTEKLSQAQLGCPAGELRRLDGPTALKGFQHLQAHALSSTSPGADQIAELATYQGMLAACIWADPAAKWQWRQGDVEHATLMLHALLERPMPAAEVATDDGVMLRIQLSTSTM